VARRGARRRRAACSGIPRWCTLLAAWDDVHHWSQRPEWRRANGWLLPFERPLSLTEHSLNQASTAFARPRGKLSSRLDFLTFAESALVPVLALPTDDLVRCQEFTRLRALGGFLGTPFEPQACPAFDAWDPARQLSTSKLLVQASGRAPESLFGHLVRPVWRSLAQLRHRHSVRGHHLPQLGRARAKGLSAATRWASSPSA
jgi:hypothetical protein